MNPPERRPSRRSIVGERPDQDAYEDRASDPISRYSHVWGNVATTAVVSPCDTQTEGLRDSRPLSPKPDSLCAARRRPPHLPERLTFRNSNLTLIK